MKSPEEKTIFAERRARVLAQIDDGVAIFIAPPETSRNSDVHNDFRQSSDLYYLTGFDEPEVALVLVTKADEPPRSIIFLREKNKEREIWDGPRLGTQEACGELGVDEAHPIEDFEEKVVELMLGARRLYYDLGSAGPEGDDELVTELFRRAKRRKRRAVVVPEIIQDASPLIHELRLVKSAEEISVMREAARLTAIGHRRAMTASVPGIREYQIMAAMEYEWIVRGAERNAYPSIVGSGPNACILHYRAGERVVDDGDLVLVDAGCEKSYYASDVTRTWPVNGQFTDEQRAIYQIVLRAQKVAIQTCRVGETMSSVHEAAVRSLVDGLIELELLDGPSEVAIEKESYKRFYMHQTSHWIGMDVHDAGAYLVDGKPRPFQTGMVLTVEPGIYVSPDDMDVPAKFRGIGIRIEDDILVTAEGPVNLTEETPKEVDEIEALVGSLPLAL